MTRYRIGAFAQVSGVSAKTLRFYDQVGLLRPTRVDPRTGYRFYRPRVVGPKREIYHDQVLEIQFPVGPA